jgi:uncharacterized protein YndB with AHSA1/START domain
MEDRIEKSIELKAPVARVWRALTDHREFGEWFRVDLEGPFAVGEVSRGQMTYPGCEHMRWKAVVRTMEPERLFAFSWSHREDPPEAADDPDDPMTLVEFLLEPTPRGTRLTVTESGFAALPEGMRARAMRDNDKGWEEQMANLQAYVS